MTYPTPEQYFVETGLYQRIPLDSPADKQGLVRVQFHVDPLDVFCTGCAQHSIFRSTVELPDVGPGIMTQQPATSVDHLLQAKRALLPHTDEDFSSLSQQDVLAYVSRPKYFTTIFHCSRNPTHELRFVTRVTEAHFEKIGQFPSLAEVRLGDLTKYRKILGGEYAELSRGVGLFAHGIGVGSFVYLRRIFERQIEQAHSAALSDGGWDEDAYQRSRMDERILLLKQHLPEFLVDNRAIYAVLSKGIHELSEAECLEYFPAVRVAIELILDAKLEALEKAKKVQGNQATISTILSKLKNR
jgi:hypothetical protein